MNRVKNDSFGPCEEQEFFSSQVLSLRLEQRGGGDMTANRFESQLREGVKELECLYSLTRLVEESENSVDKILQGG